MRDMRRADRGPAGHQGAAVAPTGRAADISRGPMLGTSPRRVGAGEGARGPRLEAKPRNPSGRGCRYPAPACESGADSVPRARLPRDIRPADVIQRVGPECPPGGRYRANSGSRLRNVRLMDGIGRSATTRSPNVRGAVISGFPLRPRAGPRRSSWPEPWVTDGSVRGADISEQGGPAVHSAEPGAAQPTSRRAAPGSRSGGAEAQGEPERSGSGAFARPTPRTGVVSSAAEGRLAQLVRAHA